MRHNKFSLKFFLTVSSRDVASSCIVILAWEIDFHGVFFKCSLALDKGEDESDVLTQQNHQFYPTYVVIHVIDYNNTF